MLSATLDLTDVERGLASMGRASFAKAFRDLKKPMRLDTRDHQKSRSGPEGSWAPRAASTMARLRRKRSRRKPMGRLPTAVSYLARARSLTGISRAPWSGVHVTGGTVGKGSRIAARPFLWMSDEFLAEANARMKAEALNAFGGR